jgi:hypothetical protein
VALKVNVESPLPAEGPIDQSSVLVVLVPPRAAGEKVALTPLGRPLTERSTSPVEPL